MKKTILSVLFVTALIAANAQESFQQRVVTTGLSFPWEITWGPDQHIWVTERTGKRVTRVHPATGTKTTAITIAEVYQSAGQDGLMGMALHPNLLQGTGEDYVYVAYTYDADPGGGVNRRTKIRRYTYDSVSKTLSSPVDLITNIPASNDHNSGRLVYGPDAKLYYTVGDMGNNQFGNMCSPIRAQDLPTSAQVSSSDWTRYQGKILRLNTDGSIPADNPVLSGTQSHVFSYGHRNAQGLVFGLDGKLYADEHGPKSDDEINWIQSGKNYGWPRVAGYNDDQAYVYGNWSASSPQACNTLSYSDYNIPASVPIQNENSFSHVDFTEPIKTLFTVPNGYNFQDPDYAGNYFIGWPTVGPSSLDIYTREAGGIPDWANSLLVVSLKKGRIYRLKLSADGTTIVGDTTGYWYTQNRYRDIALNPDARTFYVSTDNSGSTSGPTTGWTSSLSNPGSILEFQYTGILLDLDTTPTRPRVVTDMVRIFPNPVQNLLRVEGKKDLRKPLMVQLYDVSGRKLLEFETFHNSFDIDMQPFRPGIYMMKLYNAYGIEVQIEKIIRN